MGSNIEQTTSTGQSTTQQQAPTYLQPHLQQYNTDVLRGNYLNSNPYLDETFNQAADVVQNRLGTQYASAGRNLAAMRNPQSQELNSLANQIYGGNYQAERDRMQGVANANAERSQTSNMSSSNPMYTNDWSSLLGGVLGVSNLLGGGGGNGLSSIGSSLGGAWDWLTNGSGTSNPQTGDTTGGQHAADAPSGLNTPGGGLAGGVAGSIGAGLLGSGGTPAGTVSIIGPTGELVGGGAVAGTGGTAAGGTAAGGGAAAGGTAGGTAAGGIGAGNAGLGAAAGTAAIIALPAALGMADLFGNEATGDRIGAWTNANGIPVYRTSGGRGAGMDSSVYGQLPDGRLMSRVTMDRLSRMDQASLSDFLGTFAGDQLPLGWRLEGGTYPSSGPSSGGGILTPGTRFNGRVGY